MQIRGVIYGLLQVGFPIPCISHNAVSYTHLDVYKRQIQQSAAAFLKTEYERLGMDASDIQTSYILRTGLKMLGVSLLAVVATILVGFLASRVAASLGRDLRSRVFKKVVSFSNQEMDEFSTASLITRSTNDIQQIQMLMVMLLRIVCLLYTSHKR